MIVNVSYVPMRSFSHAVPEPSSKSIFPPPHKKKTELERFMWKGKTIFLGKSELMKLI